MVLRDGTFHVVDSSELAFDWLLLARIGRLISRRNRSRLNRSLAVEIVAPVEIQKGYEHSFPWVKLQSNSSI
jgi:hypothetical protein